MTGFVERIGLALVAPRRALAVADEGEGGSTDLAWLLLLKVLATELTAIVAAGWQALVVGPAAAAGPLLGRVQGAVGRDLVVWLAAGVAITVLAGARRSPGRDFDLAAVAWVPSLAVELAAALALSALGRRPSPALAEVVTVVALGWTAAVALLAVAAARRRAPVGEAA